MSEMNCKQYRAEIEESEPGAGRAGARLASHAAGCAECRGFGDESASLRGLIAGLARVDAPPDFELRLRARIRAADSSEAPSWSRLLRPRAAWLAAAGCVALAAALAFQTRNISTPGAPAAVQPQAAAQSGANSAAPEAAKPEVANAATGDTNGGVASRSSSGGVATRDSAGGRVDEIAGGESSAPRGGLNDTAAARRGSRPPVAAKAAQQVGEVAASGNDLTPQLETNTLSMRASPVIVTAAIPLPVSADERPLQVLFKDTQGESRVVNVEPITFGSNEPAARPTNVTFTKAAKKHGVW